MAESYTLFRCFFCLPFPLLIMRYHHSHGDPRYHQLKFLTNEQMSQMNKCLTIEIHDKQPNFKTSLEIVYLAFENCCAIFRNFQKFMKIPIPSFGLGCWITVMMSKIVMIPKCFKMILQK